LLFGDKCPAGGRLGRGLDFRFKPYIRGCGGRELEVDTGKAPCPSRGRHFASGNRFYRQRRKRKHHYPGQGRLRFFRRHDRRRLRGGRTADMEGRGRHSDSRSQDRERRKGGRGHNLRGGEGNGILRCPGSPSAVNAALHENQYPCDCKKLLQPRSARHPDRPFP